MAGSPVSAPVERCVEINYARRSSVCHWVTAFLMSAVLLSDPLYSYLGFMIDTERDWKPTSMGYNSGSYELNWASHHPSLNPTAYEQNVNKVTLPLPGSWTRYATSLTILPSVRAVLQTVPVAYPMQGKWDYKQGAKMSVTTKNGSLSASVTGKTEQQAGLKCDFTIILTAK